MSVDLGTQIRDYAREVDVAQTPMSLDEITERRLGSDPVRPVGRIASPVRLPDFTPRLVAVTAAAVLVFLGAATLLFQVTGQDIPAATTPSVPTTVVDSVQTTRAPFVATPVWSRVPSDRIDQALQYQEMRSVTAGGPGFVAVGTEESADSTTDGAVWTSVDGITWTHVPPDEAAFGGEGWRQIADVTTGGPGLVAVGSIGVGSIGDGTPDDYRGPDVDAAVWTSVDGFSWSRVPFDEAVFGGARMLSVTTGGPGLVAVGGEGQNNHEIGTFGSIDAVVWTSVDGIAWSRVPNLDSVFGGDGGQEMWSVTAGGPGLVAVGAERPGDSGGRDPEGGSGAVWTSKDGFTWSKVPFDEAVFGGDGWRRMMDVTAAGPGLVAVGFEWVVEDVHAVVWTSVDGFTWSRVPYERIGGVHENGHQTMTSVTVGGPGLVAVGETTGGAGIWTSVDGITWSAVPFGEDVFGEAYLWGVAAGGPGLVAVGPQYTSGKWEPAVWVARE